MIGTGASPRDVTLRGGYREDGDWIKHNGIKADRADGFYLSNMRAMLFRENAFYVHETDGYVLDRFEGSHNDLYGVLTFTSDHGVISNCNAHHNGDSGVYPGSAADVNSTSRNTGPLNRWATEVVNCNLHHNALGMSGTAGNSLYVHNNRIHHNGLGFIVESILGGHPGMPQDHGWFEDNKIYSNNENYYEKYVQGEDAPCQSRVAREVGHHKGVVCPAFGFPVGTGGIIVGNHNFINSNQVWDNWRQGFMLFWVPPALLRGDYNPLHQQDNSNHNAFTKNELGYSPKGKVLPNGIDFYWDEAGDGNCWQDNLTAPGKEVTHNYAIDLPDCGNPSQWPIGNLIKTTQLIPCATYDRRSEPDPAGCDWLDTPEKPSSDSGSAGSRASEQPGDGPGAPAALLAVTLVGTLGIRLASARRQRAKADQ
nr:right-handed parallel beta-helix repeat-containing protein [Nocardioides marinisabuli]